VVFFQSISALSLFLYDAAPVQAGSEAFFYPKTAQIQFLFSSKSFVDDKNTPIS
jgi:hypothetical protein